LCFMRERVLRAVKGEQGELLRHRSPARAARHASARPPLVVRRRCVAGTAALAGRSARTAPGVTPASPLLAPAGGPGPAIPALPTSAPAPPPSAPCRRAARYRGSRPGAARRPQERREAARSNPESPRTPFAGWRASQARHSPLGRGPRRAAVRMRTPQRPRRPSAGARRGDAEAEPGAVRPKGAVRPAERNASPHRRAVRAARPPECAAPGSRARGRRRRREPAPRPRRARIASARPPRWPRAAECGFRRMGNAGIG